MLREYLFLEYRATSHSFKHNELKLSLSEGITKIEFKFILILKFILSFRYGEYYKIRFLFAYSNQCESQL